MSKKPSGRPKKAKAERRGNVLRIRLTLEERGVLDAAAESQALDVSAWGRMVLMKAARPAVNRTGGGES
jgi:uncharacterized protein (DUF1778 family)